MLSIDHENYEMSKPNRVSMSSMLSGHVGFAHPSKHKFKGTEYRTFAPPTGRSPFEP